MPFPFPTPIDKHKFPLKDYEKNGLVVLPTFWMKHDMGEYERCFKAAMIRQARKVSPGALWNTTKCVEYLAEHDPVALRHAIYDATHSRGGHLLCGDANLNAVVSGMLQMKEGIDPNLVISGPNTFVNVPHDKRRVYGWHIEQHWYPKRMAFVNCWTPFIHHKSEVNGPMEVIPGSHLSTDWRMDHFNEYDAEKGSGLRQYELCSSLVNELSEKHGILSLRLDVGDMVLFHPRLVHRSTVNKMNYPSYALTLRFFDYTDDLTVSSQWSETPYGATPNGRVGL